MILTPQELVEVYEAMVKPFGHPDPLGYMTRALIVSEGDPDYIDVEGKRGFLPVLPQDALELVGAQEVQSLQGNLIASLAMDRVLFDQFGTVNKMIIASEFGADNVGENLTPKQKQFIEDVDDSREDTHKIMYPPFAKVEDIIKLLDENKIDPRLSNKRKSFFEFLLGKK